MHAHRQRLLQLAGGQFAAARQHPEHRKRAPGHAPPSDRTALRGGGAYLEAGALLRVLPHQEVYLPKYRSR